MQQIKVPNENSLNMLTIFTIRNLQFLIWEANKQAEVCGFRSVLYAFIFYFQAILLYNFIDTIDKVPYYHGNKIQGLQDLFCWIIASAPFLAIPACMIQACGEEEGTCMEVRAFWLGARYFSCQIYFLDGNNFEHFYAFFLTQNIQLFYCFRVILV